MPEPMPSSETCTQCKLIIVDNESDSVECSICGGWVHSWKECSKLKKSIFKLLGKKDSWVCPKCIETGRDNVRLTAKLNEELQEVRDMNFCLFEENIKLKARIKELEGGVNATSQPNTEASLLSPLRPGGAGTLTTDVGNGNSINVHPNRPTTMAKPNDCVLQSKPNCILQKKSHSTSVFNVSLVGDSHIRNLRSFVQKEVESELTQSNSSFSMNVTSVFYPNAPMQTFVEKGLKSCTRPGANRNSSLVFLGGVNDTSDLAVDETIKLFETHASQFRPEDIMVVETPYRYDNPSLNKSIFIQNRRLKELCTKFGWTYIPINFSLFRMHYNKAGLHLNHIGKKLVSKLIAMGLTNSGFLVL